MGKLRQSVGRKGWTRAGSKNGPGISGPGSWTPTKAAKMAKQEMHEMIYRFLETRVNLALALRSHKLPHELGIKGDKRDWIERMACHDDVATASPASDMATLRATLSDPAIGQPSMCCGREIAKYADEI